LARSPEKAALLEGLGARPVQFDVFDRDELARAIDGHDVVIHMATHIPRHTRPRPGQFAETDRLRSELTPALVEVARAGRIGRIVKESITFNYEDRGEEWIDEDTPIDTGTYTSSAVDAENAVAGFNDGERIGVALRFGMFYGPDAQSTIDTVQLARRRLAMTVGGPDAFMSSIHTDDAAAAVVAALGAPAGLYNVVEDEPMTRADHFAALAEAFGIKPPKIAPAALGKLGGKRLGPLARSQRISNRRFKEATGWAPQYPSAREGWKAIAAVMS
jgi:nucleoside-diphosphate-sugar epimerase